MKTNTIMRWLAGGMGIVLCCSEATATPSSQIWIPSTDVQAFNTWHLGLDNYVRSSARSNITEGHRDPNIFDAGLTVGLLPFEKVKLEAGIDCIVSGTAYDSYPLYFNAKLGIPEDSLARNMPALAVGGFAFGTNNRKDSPTRTDQNILYVLTAKSLPSLGRLSLGYYVGNENVLLGTEGETANDGVLLSWDRTLHEISDKLWAAVDYQGGGNSLSGLSFGMAWSFSKDVSVIFGYNMWDEPSLAGSDTFTIQLDINIP